MSYLSKDTYARKREYAYKTSSDGVERIASYIIADAMSPNDPNAEKRMDELVEELQPIAELSHKRHEIHSTDRSHFIYDSSELHEIGDDYSVGETLIDRVNALNDKYHLVDGYVGGFGEGVLPDFDTDTDEEILSYYGEEPTGNDTMDHERCYELMTADWDNVINQWSRNVREWFRKLNQKVGSSFPD